MPLWMSYVLDADGINLWKSGGLLEPCWVFEDTKQDQFTVQIVERGSYAILTHNIQESPTAIQVTLTFSGYERDLLWASIIFVVAGVLIAVLSSVKLRNKGANEIGS